MINDPGHKRTCEEQSDSGRELGKIDQFIADIYETSVTKKPVDELEEYLSSEVENINTCVLSFWRQKIQCWPRLSMMARDYLASTATSASSERSFSAGRHLLGLYRQSLLPNTMQACLCLRSWARCGFGSQTHNQIQNQEDGEENIQPMNTE